MQIVVPSPTYRLAGRSLVWLLVVHFLMAKQRILSAEASLAVRTRKGSMARVSTLMPPQMLALVEGFAAVLAGQCHSCGKGVAACGTYGTA